MARLEADLRAVQHRRTELAAATQKQTQTEAETEEGSRRGQATAHGQRSGPTTIAACSSASSHQYLPLQKCGLEEGAGETERGVVRENHAETDMEGGLERHRTEERVRGGWEQDRERELADTAAANTALVHELELLRGQIRREQEQRMLQAQGSATFHGKVLALEHTLAELHDRSPPLPDSPTRSLHSPAHSL